MPTKFFDPKRREFREFFGAEEAARLTPCNDDKPKNAEIMPFRACSDLHPMLITLELNGVKLKFSQNELIDLGLSVADGKKKYAEILDFIQKHKT